MDLFEIVGRLSIDGVDRAERQLNNVSNTAESTSSKFSNLVKGIGKGMLVATGAVVAGSAGIVSSVSSSYGALQQSIGGIETLFGKSAKKVIENANKAFKTAGLSANDYMQQVTSFSASLLQSLGGDTEKACSVADRAIIDMADNANKMGTSMESITNAYQGFAKQNFTMLDNLKLGYGGTKTEMQRLIKDASKMTKVQKELGVTVDGSSMSFGNIINAISVMQEELGIAGATADEAGKTIEGSFGSLSASWQNFLAGLGNPSANMKVIIQDLANSIVGAIKNVTPVVENIVKVLPTVMDSIVGVISSMMPTLINTFSTLITNVVNAIAQLLPKFIPLAVDCIITISQALLANAPLLIDAGKSLIVSLIDGIGKAIPTLSPVLTQLTQMFGDMGELWREVLQPAVMEVANAFMYLFGKIAEMIPNINAGNVVMTVFRNACWLVEDILYLVADAIRLIADNLNIIVPLLGIATTAFISFKAGAMIQSVVQGFQSAQVALALFRMEQTGTTIAQGVLNGQLTLGQTIVALFTGQVTLAEIATGLWAKGQAVLNAVMSANPIALVVMAIGTLIAILVVAYNKSETFRNIVDSLWGKIKEFGSKLIEWAKGIPDAIVTAFNTVINFIGTFIENVKTFFKNGIDAIVTFFSQSPEQIGYHIGSALAKVVMWAIDMGNKAKEAGKNFINNVVNFIKNLPSKIATWLANTILKVTSWGSNMASKAKSVATNFINNVVNFIKNLPSKVSTLLAKVITTVTTWGTNLAKKGKTSATNLFNSIVNGIKNLPSKMLSIGTDIVKGLWNGISNAGGWLKNKVSGFASGVVKGFKDSFKIKSPSRIMRDEIGVFLPQGIGEGIEEDDSAEKSMKNKVASILDVANGSLSNINVGTTVDNLLTKSPIQQYQLDFNAQISNLNDGFERLISLVGQYLPDITANTNRPLLVDGDSLAVGMGRRMDAQLGKIAISKGRGNV